MDGVTAWIAAHRKLIVAIVGAGLTLAIQYWGSDNLWISFAILVATSAGVYGAPNTSSRPGSNADSAGAGTPAK